MGTDSIWPSCRNFFVIKNLGFVFKKVVKGSKSDLLVIEVKIAVTEIKYAGSKAEDFSLQHYRM